MKRDPFEGDVSKATLRKWLIQFKDDEIPIIKKLLASFDYYSVKKSFSLLGKLHMSIFGTRTPPFERTWFVPVGSVSRSGDAIAYFYRKQNGIPPDRFVSLERLPEIAADPGDTVVFLDNFIRTGRQACSVWAQLPESIKGSSRTVFAVLVGFKKGIERIKNETGFEVRVLKTMTKSDLPLSRNSRVFVDEKERRRASRVLTDYGKKLFPKYNEIYGRSHLLLGFFYSAPEVTSPIFWSTQDGWMPLLPGGRSFWDSSVYGDSAEDIMTHQHSPSQKRLTLATEELEKYNLPEDMAVKIIREYGNIVIYLVLAPILKELDVDTEALSHLLDVTRLLRELEEEKAPVKTSVLLVPFDHDPRTLGDFYLTSTLKLNDKDNLMALAKITTPYDSAVVVQPDGRVLGNCLFDFDANVVDSFLPPRFHTLAYSTWLSGGILFFFPGDGAESIFHKGRRILKRRQASWHQQPPDLSGELLQLSTRHSIDAKTLESLFQIALRLTDDGLGALITIGDHEEVLRHCEAPRESAFTVKELNIGLNNDSAIISLMKQDGATIISSNGKILRYMTQIMPPAGTEGQAEAGRGKKHNTAVKISTITKALCIAVSVSGTISVYANGKRVLYLVG
ncbi:MAG: DNA integrity scanning protein DisA nucleotide-binding domain protein [Candidatus Thorarchaeota archaeon]